MSKSSGFAPSWIERMSSWRDPRENFTGAFLSQRMMMRPDDVTNDQDFSPKGYQERTNT